MAVQKARPLAIITGANGGIGRAVARVMGASRDLLLSDASPGLAVFARELEDEGFTVAGLAIGDLASDAVIDVITRAAQDRGGFEVLVHAAGLGPSAPWRSIVSVNWIASVKLLDRLSPLASHGTACVLIASVAGHMLPVDPGFEARVAQLRLPDLYEDLEPLLAELAGDAGAGAFGVLAYCLSKQRLIALCSEHASSWGSKDARIVSISPGMTYTPMGRHEAETDPLAAQTVAAAPLARWCTPMEIALTADFLVSRAAGFITGTDIKVDGGSTALLGPGARTAWLGAVRQARSQ